MHSSNCYVFDQHSRKNGLDNVLNFDHVARKTHQLFLSRLPQPPAMGTLYEALLETVIIEMAREAMALRAALRRDGGPPYPLPPSFKENDMQEMYDFHSPANDADDIDPRGPTAAEVDEQFKAAIGQEPIAGETAAGIDQDEKAVEGPTAAEMLQQIFGDQAHRGQLAISIFVPGSKAATFARIMRNGIQNTPGLTEEEFNETMETLGHAEKLAYMVKHQTNNPAE